jgi:D-serine deaminase-like pyridoxal phosphate-dependent protein
MTSLVVAPSPAPGLALGDPAQCLDTPAMLVDLAAMERNVRSLMERFRATAVHVRPHLKTVKSPELAQRLLAAG